MTIDRRDFLKCAAGSGLLLVSDTPPVSAAQPKELPPDAVGILYDATLCIGCKSCMVNCKKYNSEKGGALYNKKGTIPYESDAPIPLWDAPQDLSGQTLNIIKMYKNGTAAVKDRAENGYSFIQQHCLHCLDPACVSVCPVAALQKDPQTGIVFYDKDRCIGCRYCQMACPFGIPKFEWSKASPQIRKCQLCRHRYAVGGYSACCEFCPTGASLFGPVAKLREEARRRLALRPGSENAFPLGRLGSGRYSVRQVANYVSHIYGMDEAGGTQYLLLSGVPFDRLGFNPRITDQHYPELTWHYIFKVPYLIGALLVAGTAAHYLTKRKDGSGKEKE